MEMTPGFRETQEIQPLDLGLLGLVMTHKLASLAEWGGLGLHIHG